MPLNIEEVDDSASTEEVPAEELAAVKDEAQELEADASTGKKLTEAREVEEPQT